MSIRAVTLGLLLGATAPPLLAATPESYPDGIPALQAVQIIQAAMEAAGIRADPPSVPARALPACDHVPSVAPSNGDWGTVRLACTGPHAWQRTLRLRAAIKRALPHSTSQLSGPAEPARMVVTLRHTLERGSRIAPGDLELTAAVLGGPEATFADVASVSGRRLRVSVSAGAVVIPRHLELVWLVTKGSPVSIQAVGNGVSIAAPGEALDNGAYGDLVRVRNLGSGAVIRGIAASENIVEVRPNMR